VRNGRGPEANHRPAGRSTHTKVASTASSVKWIHGACIGARARVNPAGVNEFARKRSRDPLLPIQASTLPTHEPGRSKWCGWWTPKATTRTCLCHLTTQACDRLANQTCPAARLNRPEEVDTKMPWKRTRSEMPKPLTDRPAARKTKRNQAELAAGG